MHLLSGVVLNLAHVRLVPDGPEYHGQDVEIEMSDGGFMWVTETEATEIRRILSALHRNLLLRTAMIQPIT